MDDISPMVGAMIAIGVGRHELVIYYAWLVGVYPVYQCGNLYLWCPWAEMGGHMTGLMLVGEPFLVCGHV